MRTLVAATAVTLALVLTGCSGDDEDRADAPPAPEALEQAVEHLAEQDRWGFTFRLGEEQAALLRDSGTVALADGLVARDSIVDNGKREIVTQVLRRGDESWIRTALGVPRPEACWVQGRSGEVARLAGEAPVTGDGPLDLLPTLAVVGAAEADEWDQDQEGSVMTATTLLHPLVATLGQTVRGLEVDPGSTARAEVKILLDQEGHLAAWSTDLVSVLEAARDSGVELTPEMTQLVDAEMAVPVLAGFSDPVDDESLFAPPAKGRVVEHSDDEGAVERALAACNS